MEAIVVIEIGLFDISKAYIGNPMECEQIELLDLTLLTV